MPGTSCASWVEAFSGKGSASPYEEPGVAPEGDPGEPNPPDCQPYHPA